MIKAIKNKYKRLSYQQVKEKKKLALNEKDTLFLNTMIINAIHVFSILVQILKTVILNCTVKVYGIRYHTVVYSRSISSREVSLPLKILCLYFVFLMIFCPTL